MWGNRFWTCLVLGLFAGLSAHAQGELEPEERVAVGHFKNAIEERTREGKYAPFGDGRSFSEGLSDLLDEFYYAMAMQEWNTWNQKPSGPSREQLKKFLSSIGGVSTHTDLSNLTLHPGQVLFAHRMDSPHSITRYAIDIFPIFAAEKGWIHSIRAGFLQFPVSYFEISAMDFGEGIRWIDLCNLESQVNDDDSYRKSPSPPVLYFLFTPHNKKCLNRPHRSKPRNCF